VIQLVDEIGIASDGAVHGTGIPLLVKKLATVSSDMPSSIWCIQKPSPLLSGARSKAA
jgi:hypothetical protein